MNRNKKQKQSTENSGAHENSLYIGQSPEIDKAGVHYGAGPEAKGLFYF